MSDKSLADALLRSLDPSQRQVATCFSEPVGVIAGAGTGKTRAITYRIAYGALAGVFDAKNVLAVTFTTKAAGELRQRLGQLGVPQVAARTFHSAALRQAQYFWPRAFGSQLPSVTANNQPLIVQACNRFDLDIEAAGIRELAGEISWAKVSNVMPADYAETATECGRWVRGLELSQVGQILGRYEHVKNEQQLIDLDDILLCACALLLEYPEIAAEIRRTYRHLVVDEYQDVSPLQHTLLELWRGDRRDICVVGDPAQTIHSFAGANANYLLNFAQKFPDAQIIALNSDYRSTPEIVDFANRVASGQRIAGAIELRSQRPSGGGLQIRELEDETTQSATVAKWLQKRHDKGMPWSQMSVLYRLHAQSADVRKALKEAGIPFSTPRINEKDLDDREQTAQVSDAVTLTTLHAAKGLEWEAVALIGAQEGTLPLSLAQTPEQIAEEARLFYVGVTRAGSYLLTTWFRNGPFGEREASRFLPTGRAESRPQMPANSEPYRPETLLSKRCRVCGRSLRAGSDLILGRHKECEVAFDAQLLADLFEWRAMKAKEKHLPQFVIFTDAVITAIAELQPLNIAGLHAIVGVGARKVNSYGAEILEVVRHHQRE